MPVRGGRFGPLHSRRDQDMIHDARPEYLRFSEAFPTLLSYFRLPRRVTGQQELPGIRRTARHAETWQDQKAHCSDWKA